MAIQFLKAVNLSRAKGGHVAAHLAYRAGLKLTGTNDFSRRKKTIQEAYFLGWENGEYEAFSKAVNRHENRKDSRLLKELVWALPADATDEQRSQIVRTYAESLRSRFGVAVHVAIHRPSPKGEGEIALNHHAHLSLTSRAVDDKGNFSAKKILQLDRKEWLDQEKDRAAELVNSVALEPASRAPIYGEPVETLGWKITQPGESPVRLEKATTKNLAAQIAAEKAAAEALESEIEYERALTAAELRREIAAAAAAKANAERIAAAAERSRALAERNRTTTERLRSLIESASKIFGKIFRIGPVEIRRLDEKTRGLVDADERLGWGGRRISHALYGDGKNTGQMPNRVQPISGGLPEAEAGIRGDEGGIPRISLPSFDLAAISDLVERKAYAKRRATLARNIPTPTQTANLDFVSQHIKDGPKEIAPEEYDPKKHGALLSSLDQKSKPKGHGPSIG